MAELSSPRRGDCYWADLDPTEGHEQAGRRPVLVLSDDRYNERSGMIVMVPLTTRQKLSPPFSIDLGTLRKEFRASKSFALPAQVRALSVTRLVSLIARDRQKDVERCLDALLQICGRRPARSSPANEGGTP